MEFELRNLKQVLLNFQTMLKKKKKKDIVNRKIK